MKASNFSISRRLIKLVKPLLPIMILAIIMGVAGYFSAIGITILGGFAILGVVESASFSLNILFVIMLVFALLRGVLRYAEQTANHYIAFKLLALIRDQVFRALRRLAPAKLEGRGRGDLISLITADIEQLEVFYAHTISPIAIAILSSLIITLVTASYHILPALILFSGYLLVGAGIPIYAMKKGGAHGSEYRSALADTNSVMLESLRGLKETIQFGNRQERAAKIATESHRLAKKQKQMKAREGKTTAATNTVILMTALLVTIATLVLYQEGLMTQEGVLISVLLTLSSFGPVVALANLAANLVQTYASANRVFALLDEEPMTPEIKKGKSLKVFDGGQCSALNFGYNEEVILKDVNLAIPKDKIIGITGKSGSGKSTLLRLLMRFWDPDQGTIKISDQELNQVITSDLRDLESLVTQETQLFDENIENNLRIAKLDASQKELEAACKKAAIHDFIVSLPKGYQTQVGELGGSLSGGERQRLGVARAFLHDAPFLLLDEPTSNLDSLSEGIILKALREEAGGKTVLLVSHRKSTMAIADTVHSVESGRVS